MENQELFNKEETLEAIICHTCGQPIEEGKESSDPDGEPICQDCFDTTCAVCDDCGKVYLAEEGRDVTNARGRSATVCPACLESDYKECYCCNEYHHEDNIRQVGRQWYCDDCFCENYTECEDCSSIISNDESCYDEGSGQTLCESCYSSRQEEENANIHNYSYKPTPNFLNDNPADKEKPFFGFELEVENKTGNIADDAETINDAESHFYCKHDGSLYDGFEIVSHPFTWSYWKKTMSDKVKEDIFGTLGKNYRSYDTDTCGMHVHITKKYFTSKHLLKFLELFYLPENQEFILKISQRKNADYLNRWSKCNNKGKEAIKKEAESKRSFDGDRYTAVNLCNRETVEIRIFRGTLKMESFAKNMEFCKAAYSFTQGCALGKVSVENFKAFVSRQRKEYSNLHNFIVEKGL